MDFQKHRVMIASGTLLALLSGVVYLDYRRKAEYAEGAETEESPLPPVVRDQISAIEIRRPDQPVVRLEKRDGTFSVVQPVAYPVDQAILDAALDKLGELEFVSVVARSAGSHASLEVDDAHAIHVVAKVGSRDLDLRIGAYRGGNTMLRVGASNDVIAVRGSLRYAFAREVREWRNREISNVAPADVKTIAFTSDLGNYLFARDGSGSFQPVGATIARYDASRIDAIVTTLAHLRATDFAGDADTATANMGTPRGRVTLHVETPASGDAGVARVEDIVLVLGGEKADTRDVFVQRQGNPTIYVAASHLAEKLRPALAAFQQAVPTDGGVPPAAPEGEAPVELQMPQGGGTAADLPPEVLQQLLRQAQGAQH